MTDEPMSGDTPGDTRWLSYDEVAAARGIDRASAIRLARRKRWPRQEANDGTARVAVPGSFFRVTGRYSDNPPELVTGQAEVVSGQPPDESRTIKALEDAAAAHQKRADQMQAERDAERARADQAEREREEARVRAATAEGETKGLREALAEARKPFWLRWVRS